MKPVISIKHVYKEFDMKERHSGGVLLHEIVEQFVRRRKVSKDTFVALSDICLDIFPKEVIGLYGHNGAGKSTLLKLISRIIYPTSGTIEVQGQCMGLLELGASLHPEMTGRENMALMASFMGHDSKWVIEHTDPICSFADIGDFIDVPIKYYSSGMKLRLAFSIVTEMEPDIVVFDEAFSVGDASFQEKASKRLDSFFKKAKGGIIVSHDIEFIKRHATRIVELSHGKIKSYEA